MAGCPSPFRLALQQGSHALGADNPTNRMTQINVPLLLMERAYELCTQAGENPYEYSALLVVQALFPDLEYYVPPGLDRLAASGFDDILSDHKFSVTYE